jgi:hypothetical protein
MLKTLFITAMLLALGGAYAATDDGNTYTQPKYQKRPPKAKTKSNPDEQKSDKKTAQKSVKKNGGESSTTDANGSFNSSKEDALH